MKRASRHLIVAVLAATAFAAPPAHAQTPPAAQTPDPAPATFGISINGQTIGQTTVYLSRTSDGWQIRSSGGQSFPTSFAIDKFELSYSPDWAPRSLSIEARIGPQLYGLDTTFAGGSATNVIREGAESKTVTHPVSARAVVLPNNFFGAYEALAHRLATLGVGDTLPVYVAPQAEVRAIVTAITPQRIQTTDRVVELRHYNVTIQNPGGVVNIEVAIDASDRLARIAVPGTGILVLRSDLSGVMTRDVTYSHPRDEAVFIPSLGFTIGATVTPPPPAAGAGGAKKPAIVLVAGAGSADRDEIVANVPMFGQLSGALSDAGYFVVRYDKRGIGQSGGRAEAATIQDYAEDVVRVVEWLRKRKDIDDKRIAIVGHSEGGYVAMLAASRLGDKCDALALVNAPGVPGRQFVLAQQRHALDLSDDTPEVKAAKIQIQQRILDAVTTGAWQGIPPALQKQADTLWFKSLIEFDPADVMKKVKAPVLVLQAALDKVVDPSNAAALTALSSARKDKTAALTKTVTLPSLNHLLVPATTGEISEYPSLAVRTVSPEVAIAISTWLTSVTTAK
jgi:pimeloyl-ACP methyl ester carboxylesterase